MQFNYINLIEKKLNWKEELKFLIHENKNDMALYVKIFGDWVHNQNKVLLENENKNQILIAI